MAAMMTTKELAAALDVHPATVHQWASKYGCPSLKKFFKPCSGRGGSKRGTGWDPDEVRRWLLGTNRMDRKTGKLTCICPARRKCNRKPKPGNVILKVPPCSFPGTVADYIADIQPFAKTNSPGLNRIALAHLLGAFAHACQGGGIPLALQHDLEDEGINELSKAALNRIEEIAQKTLRTASQWTEIKQALPAFSGRAGKKKGRVKK